MIIRQEKGFSLIELMITIVIFIMVIAASSQIFTALLTQFKQQSKIGETDIEGAIGLDILRRDLAHAGFGLPGDLNGAAYAEAVNDGRTFWDDQTLNDGPSTPPGAVRISDNAGIHNADNKDDHASPPLVLNAAIPNSTADVLAIKATNVGMSDTSQRWTYISNSGALPNLIKGWGTGSQDSFVATDKVVVMKPEPVKKVNILQRSGTDFWANFSDIDPNSASTLQPAADSFENFVMYGIDPSTTPRMPFNRADYYVKRPDNIPSRCAPRTGILYKATINHSDGQHTELPILDCVADMQVRFCLNARVCSNNAQRACKTDTDCPGGTCNTAQNFIVDDGTIINSMRSELERDYLMDIQVYVVAQEGQRDNNYDFSNNNSRIRFRPRAFCGTFTGDFDTVDLSRLVCGFGETAPNCTDYKKYHWRLYTIVQRPTSMK